MSDTHILIIGVVAAAGLGVAAGVFICHIGLQAQVTRMKNKLREHGIFTY